MICRASQCTFSNVHAWIAKSFGGAANKLDGTLHRSRQPRDAVLSFFPLVDCTPGPIIEHYFRRQLV